MENKCTLSAAFSSKLISAKNDNVVSISHIQVSTTLGYIPHTREKESPYLVTFLNLHAFLLFFPFRVVCTSDDGKFVVSTSIKRKILCGIFHVCMVILIVLWAYPTLRTFLVSRRNVTTVFYVTSHMGAVIGTFVLLKIGWCNSNDILCLCRLISVAPSNLQKFRLSKCLVMLCLRPSIGAICLLIFILQFLHGIFASHRVAGAEQGYEVMKSMLSPAFSFLGFNPLQWLRDLLGQVALRYVGLVIFSLFCSYSNIPLTIFLTLALETRHCITEGLIGYLNEGTHNALQVMLEYDKVKLATDQLKKLFNIFIICYYIMSLAFFAHLPQMFLNPGGDMVNRIILIGYMLFICISMYFAIQANDKAEDYMRKYIRKQHIVQNQNLGNGDQRLLLIALRQDLELDPVGVACYFFTFTKAFLSSTLGLVVTYCIIVLQMSNEKVFWED